MVIENSAFSNLTSASGSTVADIIDFDTSSLIIVNSTFEFIAGFSGGQIINSYNISKAKSINQINVEFCNFTNIDPGYRYS